MYTPLHAQPHPEGAILTDWGTTPAVMWKQAAEEEHLGVKQVSLFGRQTLKYPRSWVEQIQALSHDKVHTYNFIGTIRGGTNGPRQWVTEFAKANFRGHDWFEEEMSPPHRSSLGPFDHSDRTQHRASYDKDPTSPGLDLTYYRIMAASKFTLCPRGDHPFAARFMEAIVAGSIPVIRSTGLDLDSPFQMMTVVPYHYYTLPEGLDGSKLIYRRDWVKENTRLFLKYQTFMEGDNKPYGWVPPPGMEEVIAAVEAR